MPMQKVIDKTVTKQNKCYKQAPKLTKDSADVIRMVRLTSSTFARCYSICCLIDSSTILKTQADKL